MAYINVEVASYEQRCVCGSKRALLNIVSNSKYRPPSKISLCDECAVRVHRDMTSALGFRDAR